MLRVKNVVFKGQGFVIWIDLPAIDTCILVEIDLQVYIFLSYSLIYWAKRILLFIFCRMLDGTRESRGDAEILMATRTFRVSPRQHNSFEFFL